MSKISDEPRPQPAGVRVDEHSARITAAHAAFEALHGYSAPDDMFSPYGPKSKIGQAFAIADAILSALEPQEPVAWRWRFEDVETWTVQKNKPHWYTPDQTDIIIEPLYAPS